MKVRKILLLFSLHCLVAYHQSHASATADSATIPTTSSTTDFKESGEGSNPVVQIVGFVKDSFVRTVDGFSQLWRNKKECDRIRTKQHIYREKLKTKWQNEGRMTKDEMKQRLRSVNGGITYSEYAFLAKGKEDRGKLMNVVFLMWGAPRFLPYALMFYPSMLPSPFAPLHDGSARESGLEKASRERSFAVMQTLLQLERDAFVIPTLAKLNIFGRKKQQRHLDDIQAIGNATGNILIKSGCKGPSGCQVVMSTLEQYLYRASEFSRAEKRLTGVPRSVVVGVTQAVEGPNPITSFLPNFMNRGKVISHIRRITESDEFLVNEKVDLNSLDSAHLVEACRERLIGGPGRDDDELRTYLSEWLNAAVVQPSARLQQSGQQLHYNSNLARLSLLCYFALDGTRDQRSSSYLPRLLFQGPTISSTNEVSEEPGKKKK